MVDINGGRGDELTPGDMPGQGEWRLAHPLLVMVGATAVGKTRLSLQIARRYDAEIISADSRLFYRGMDIGTAKPTAAERALVRHHLVDICDPDETITLAEYQRLAYGAIDDVLSRGRLPILVGGTGQYVRALVEGWRIPEVAPMPPLRTWLARLSGRELARWLEELDPEAAQRIDRRNARRVIRALEVTLLTGQPFSHLQRKSPPPYQIKIVGLRRSRDSLYRRIDARVDEMVAAGLAEELAKLWEAGYGPSVPAMSSLGYRQLWSYLNGELSLPEAVERIKFETHRFARQQGSWFRADDPAIIWIDMDGPNPVAAAATAVADWLLAVGSDTGDE